MMGGYSLHARRSARLGRHAQPRRQTDAHRNRDGSTEAGEPLGDIRFRCLSRLSQRQLANWPGRGSSAKNNHRWGSGALRSSIPVCADHVPSLRTYDLLQWCALRPVSAISSATTDLTTWLRTLHRNRNLAPKSPRISGRALTTQRARCSCT